MSIFRTLYYVARIMLSPSPISRSTYPRSQQIHDTQLIAQGIEPHDYHGDPLTYTEINSARQRLQNNGLPVPPIIPFLRPLTSPQPDDGDDGDDGDDYNYYPYNDYGAPSPNVQPPFITSMHRPSTQGNLPDSGASTSNDDGQSGFNLLNWLWSQGDNSGDSNDSGDGGWDGGDGGDGGWDGGDGGDGGWDGGDGGDGGWDGGDGGDGGWDGGDGGDGGWDGGDGGDGGSDGGGMWNNLHHGGR